MQQQQKHFVKNVELETVHINSQYFFFPIFSMFFRLNNLPLSENAVALIKNCMISLGKVILAPLLELRQSMSLFTG